MEKLFITKIILDILTAILLFIFAQIFWFKKNKKWEKRFETHEKIIMAFYNLKDPLETIIACDSLDRSIPTTEDAEIVRTFKNSYRYLSALSNTGGIIISEKSKSILDDLNIDLMFFIEKNKEFVKSLLDFNILLPVSRRKTDYHDLEKAKIRKDLVIFARECIKIMDKYLDDYIHQAKNELN